ncbi:MAG: Hsp20/alpha crystallin family protein [Bacteroidota bacterium]|jgi:HSP20 family protein
METKELEKSTRQWPALLGDGWLDRFFNTPLDEYFSLSRIVSVPSVNVSETEREYIVSLATPGMERKDFKVESTDDTLTISAEREKEEKEEGEHYNRREYNYNSWSRTFSLPENCNRDMIDAEYKNGELKIIVPKTEVKKPKNVQKISVN